MIVDVDLVVFNCVFSRALDLNLCYIKDIISHIIVHIILFFEKKAPGRPGGFTQDAALVRFSLATQTGTGSGQLQPFGRIVILVPSSALDLGRKLINYFNLFPKYSVPHSGLKTNILEYFPNGLTSTLCWVFTVLLWC